MGVASRMVTRYRSTSAPIAAASSGLGWKTVPIPELAANQNIV